ncbi:MAG: Peptidase [Fibrobacteres bacterium]|nr:Peptidase [Fibrobacterota bacterium]
MILPALRAWPTAVLLIAGVAFAFDAGKAGFSIRYQEESSPYRVGAVFLMPGEVLKIQVEGRETGTFSLDTIPGETAPDSSGPTNPAIPAIPAIPASAHSAPSAVPAAVTAPKPSAPSPPSASAADTKASGVRSWKWRAPDSAGLYPLMVRRDGTADSILLNAIVMVPSDRIKEGYLEGYHIGSYPKSPLKGLEFYRTPKGFIRVDERTARVRISPHFRLGQFICKQSPSLPAFLLLKERLILKLELVLEKANQAGYACETFHVMSGYRTPFYNRLIGNVKFSAHQFGGAADIFIDAAPQDGEMDDLNGDGRSDGSDSELLFNLVDGMSVNEFFLPYIGGIGKYSKNESHGAFVHVDVRGFRAVW